MAPAAQLAALQRIETLGLELVGIVHSHPSGPRHPSPTDMAEFYYPGVPALIVSPSPAGGWQAGAFQIETTGYRSIALDGCEGAHPGPLSWVII
jgi:proteasome lid subunit RPN8/RPN11